MADMHTHALISLWKLAFMELDDGPLQQHCLDCVTKAKVSLTVLLSLASVCVANAEPGTCLLLRCFVEKSSLWNVLVQHYCSRSSINHAEAFSIVVAHCSALKTSYGALQSFDLDEYEETVLAAIVGRTLEQLTEG